MRKILTLSSLSLRTILIFLIIFVVVIPDLFIFTFVYNDVKGALENDLNDNATNSVNLLNENITQFVTANSFTINHLSQELSGNLSQKKKFQDLLSNINQSDSNSEAITYGNSQGQYVRSPEAKLTTDIRQEQWYKLAMAHPGKIVITPPFVSTLTKKITVIIAKTTRDNQAAVSMDVSLSTLNKLTDRVVVGDHGYAFLLDENGKWIANPKTEAGQSADRSIADRARKSSKGLFEVTQNGQDNRIFYVTNPSTGWKIGGVMRVSEIYSKINPLIYAVSFLIGLFLVVFITLALLFIIFRIIRPLKKFVLLFTKISAGDLSQKLGNDIKVNKEFTELTTSMNHMIDSLSKVLESINQKAESLAASSEELTASTEENKATSDEIANSIQEIAIGSNDQSEKVSDTSRHAEVINKEIENITTKTGKLGQTANQASQTVSLGTQSLEKVAEQMNLIKQTNQKVAVSLDELVAQVQDIGKMSELINDIAEQTNLLSLNAAIEAARAGENGKGFAVVAEEIRKLAEQSQKSSKQISQVVATIHAKSLNAKDSMNGGIKEVEKGNHVVEEADQAFDAIQLKVQTVDAEIKNVADSVHNISKETESVVATFDRIAQIAKDASSNSDNVSAAAEEQSASMEEVAVNATTLSTMADELHQLVATFKLRN
ncbi:methyl-accepting chemotaxis protein [Sporolactobacillus shoreae]|uniref:Methyl-accepting chemotaxis protein n=1 Tax=Sporolactobacillus shoreae TaxID=1465501 RepID=A0A4Z0GLB0_9BACL|nr:methyl-accepting chemotaxis protein [Sporolactobacillus shoreae]TGA96927.1 methyl-accepting chemotaxis protein [Sporolactobacillus shoreae]